MLTPRQTEILALTAQGYSNAEIAAELGTSLETVKTHMRKALERLGARNRTHAVALWMQKEGRP